MSNLLTLADSINNAINTGKEATFTYNGTLYTLSPAGLVTFLNSEGKSRILASSGVGVTHTGDTNETVLATVTIPAGIMGLNGALRINSLWSTPGGSGNTKTLKIRLGGISGSTFLSVALTTTLGFIDINRIIQNRNSASSQVSKNIASSIATTGAAATTASVNTSAAQDLVFTAQLASAGESITLEQYLVELILP